MIDALKTEKPVPGENAAAADKRSQKSLNEFEKTITALKQVIEKLQLENKKLKHRPPSGTTSASSEKLKVFQ
jgi:hypothetical protein